MFTQSCVIMVIYVSNIEGSEQKDPICILTILIKSSLKIHCRAYLIRYYGQIYRLSTCTLLFVKYKGIIMKLHSWCAIWGAQIGPLGTKQIEVKRPKPL